MGFITLILFFFGVLPVYAQTGAVCWFFEMQNGEGASFADGVGEKEYVGRHLNDKISSVRVLKGYELIIYEHRDFKGRHQVFAQRKTPALYNLKDFGFDNRLTSYRIRDISSPRADSGMDETPLAVLYEKKDGKGTSFAVRPGRHPEMEKGLNDRISSVWVAEGEWITLYQHENFSGARITVRGDHGGTLHNLGNLHFDNVASSYMVSGIKEDPSPSRELCRFYEHADGKGRFFSGVKGRHPYITKKWTNRISSIRIFPGNIVHVYTKSAFLGKTKAFSARDKDVLVNLVHHGLNDQISSYAAGVSGDSPSGPATSGPPYSANLSGRFYESENGRGKHFDASTGKNDFIPPGWNNRISSVWVGPGYTISVHENARLSGRNIVLHGGASGKLYNLSDFHLDDSISSYHLQKQGISAGHAPAPDLPPPAQNHPQYLKHRETKHSFTEDVIFFDKSRGKGRRFSGRVGKYSGFPKKWHNRVSSVWVNQGYAVTLFSEPRFAGRKIVLYGKPGGVLYELKDFHFDNQPGSFEIQKTN